MPTSLFDQLKYSPKNDSVVAIIKEFEKNYADTFDRVKTRWNSIIREFLRDSTSLKLSSRDIAQKTPSIQISFTPDRGNEFIKLIDEHFPELNFNEYSSFQQLLLTLNGAKPHFKNHEKRTAFNNLHLYLSDYFKKYNIQNLHEKLFDEMSDKKDVFGTYTYLTSNIELYYVPLIIFTQIHQISLEYLIVVVLTHELAHAYHHIGKDTDNVEWTNMGITDLHIIEGLAQYYTALFVENKKVFYPGLEIAYKKLLEHQSGPYRAHLDWLKNYQKEHVKHALYAARRTGIKNKEIFEEFLHLSKGKLG